MDTTESNAAVNSPIHFAPGIVRRVRRGDRGAQISVILTRLVAQLGAAADSLRSLVEDDSPIVAPAPAPPPVPKLVRPHVPLRKRVPLHRFKVSHAAQAGGICRKLIDFDGGTGSTAKERKLHGVYLTYASAIQWAIHNAGYKIARNIRTGGAAYTAAFAWAWSHSDRDKVEALARDLKARQRLPVGSPAALLRDYLASMPKKTSTKVHAWRILCCIEAAINGAALTMDQVMKANGRSIVRMAHNAKVFRKYKASRSAITRGAVAGQAELPWS